MLDTGSPPAEHDKKHLGSVSPSLSSHHAASTSSTPGLSSLDGTPRCRRLCSLPLPPRPHSAPPTAPDMAIKPASLRKHDGPSRAEDLTTARMAMDMAMSPVACQVPPDAYSQTESMEKQHPRPPASLSDISRLLRLQKYHKRRCYQAEDNLHYLQLAAAKTSRLVRSAAQIHHTLAECIRGEDKHSFASLLDAFHDACDDVLAPVSASLQDSRSTYQHVARCSSPFLEELSSPSKLLALDLLSKVRNDGHFLADRLASLNHKELIALLPERNIARLQDSIFGLRSNSRVSKPLGLVVDAQIELLSSHAYSSPLETLIFAFRGIPDGNALGDDATQVWAAVCARLVSEQKPGSEKVVPAILDIWSTASEWPGKQRLEIWIVEVLQRGAFLLEHPSHPSFRARMSGRPDISPEEQHRAETFFAQTADSLLDLFADSHGPSVIPPGVLRMCQAVMASLSERPGHQRAFPQFVLVRWLLHTFVSEIVTLPEAHGLLVDHYISEHARTRILREVASRAQRSVFDVVYSWKHSNTIPTESVQRVQCLRARLAGSPGSDKARGTARGAPGPEPGAATFVVLSARDVVVTLNALYPIRRPASVASDRDSVKSGLLSSASSMSGLSLFGHARTPEPFSELFNSAPGMQHGRATEPSGYWCSSESNEDSDLDVQMHQVCVELEGLVGSRSEASMASWDVLVLETGRATMRMIRDKAAQICADATVLTNATIPNCHSLSRDRSKEHVANRKAVEAILCDSDVARSGLELDTHGSAVESLAKAQKTLEDIFQQCIEDCQERSDFVQAHSLTQELQALQSYVSRSVDRSALSDLLCDIEHFVSKAIGRAAALSDACEAWSHGMTSSAQLKVDRLEPILRQQEDMRDKMWYVAEVRLSAAYEEAKSITSALQIMGKGRKEARTRLSPPLRHWSGSKLSSNNLHLKTEAQVLEILSARSDHGGPNKLSDDQSRVTQLWMDRQNVDNLCRGEERLHRLCMEVRKCAETVTAPTDTSTLWHNSLFVRDASLRQHQQLVQRPTFITGLYDRNGHSSLLSLRSHPRSNDTLASTAHTLSTTSSRDQLDLRSPTLTNSTVPFWSPATTEVESPSSATSIGSVQAQSVLEASMRKREHGNLHFNSTTLEKLRQRVTSLLLSDLTATAFSEGSETDIAFWSGLGFDLTARHFRGLQALDPSVGSQTPTIERQRQIATTPVQFDFDGAFAMILRKFAARLNPWVKLECLYDLDRLLVPYMAEQAAAESPIAASQSMSASGRHANSAYDAAAATEMSVRGFRAIFARASLRPLAIFRDLQYIAALVPSAVLQNTSEGKAFCNAAVAISSLKREARKIMVETADSIIAYHSNNRGHGRTSSTAQQQRDFATFSAPSRTPSAEEVARYSMADAAYLLQIAAKEGDTVAQRELGTLYLTHPELMDRIIAPFTRPRDVFKEELESKWRKNQDPNRCDPQAMCIAYHWMELSSKGGDSLAREYLRQREEMDSF